MRSRKVRWYRSRGFSKKSKCGRFEIIPRLASGTACPLICKTKPSYYDMVDHEQDVEHNCLATQAECRKLANSIVFQEEK